MSKRSGGVAAAESATGAFCEWRSELYYLPLCLLFLPHLRLITHIGHRIHRDERLRILPIDKIHQLLVFAFIHDCDDFIMLFQIIRANCLVNRCSTMQLFYDKAAQLFFFFRNNADTAFDIVVKNKMIQNDSVKIGAQNTQHHRLYRIRVPQKALRTCRIRTSPFPDPYGDTYS